MRWGWVVLGFVGGLASSASWSLRAQERGLEKVEVPRNVAPSVQDALLKPLDLPFGEEATLEEVRRYLARTLEAPVVLDLAALDRLDLDPEDTVQLDLKGVRLKVGLKLLLDQVGLTYKVVPEDNLLILTDPESTEDASVRTLGEVKALHREMHDLQDAVDDLRDLLEEELEIENEPERHGPMIVRASGRERNRSRRKSSL
jgi:hypothetical protein